MNPVPEQYLEKRFSPIWWKLLLAAWVVVGLLFMIPQNRNGVFDSFYFLGFWLAAFIPIAIAAYYLKIHARETAWVTRWKAKHPPLNRFPWYVPNLVRVVWVAWLFLYVLLARSVPDSMRILWWGVWMFVCFALLALESFLKYHSRKRVPKNKA